MSDHILFEQPLTERIRTVIRLDHLFAQAHHHLHGPTEWDSRAAVTALIGVLELLSRGDLKTELLKELERYQATLKRLAETPAVDDQRLRSVLEQLAEASARLLAHKGPLGQSLRDNEFLNAIRQRGMAPGGASHIDLPAYALWLHAEAADRQMLLQNWLEQLDPVRRPVALLLDLLRGSSVWEEQTAPGGFFQRNLDSGTGHQLIRVRLPRAQGLFAEISAGRHRFSLRFLQFSASERPRQVAHDVRFELSCCGL